MLTGENSMIFNNLTKQKNPHIPVYECVLTSKIFLHCTYLHTEEFVISLRLACEVSTSVFVLYKVWPPYWTGSFVVP